MSIILIQIKVLLAFALFYSPCYFIYFNSFIYAPNVTLVKSIVSLCNYKEFKKKMYNF